MTRGKAQSRARLALKWERILERDLEVILNRMARVLVRYANRQSLAERAIQKYEPIMARVILSRSSAVARAFIEIADRDINPRARKHEPDVFEVKRRLDTVAIANRSAIAWLKERGGRLVRGITERLRKKLSTTLQRGYRAGAGEDELAAMVERAFSGEIARGRAARIARTEIHTASNHGTYEAAVASERELIKKWLAVEDKRTRKAHAKADGQERALDKPFKVDGFDMAYPGDPSAPPHLTVNCRCTFEIIPVRTRRRRT